MSNDLFGMLVQHGLDLKAAKVKHAPHWSIRAKFRDFIGRADIKLPYVFTSEVNAKTAVVTLNTMGTADQISVIKDFFNIPDVDCRSAEDIVFLLVAPDAP